VKEGASIPILEHDIIHAAHHQDETHHEKETKRSAVSGQRSVPAEEHSVGHEVVIDAANYANPLPHVLMLTAIVVGVATLGVGLAVAQKVYAEYGSLEEDEILAKIRASDD
jgi:multicomponent Na+:H+ antiporter subunit C